MATARTFEDLEVWQKARELTRAIYRVTNQSLFRRDFGLRDQIRKAAVSIMSNIAEGFERSGTGEFVQFLAMAKGSAGEVRSQLYVALDQEYLDEATFKKLAALAESTSQMASGLMRYLQGTSIRGDKYRTAPSKNVQR